MSAADEAACQNTDRELWREGWGDFYAPSIHVTQAGSIGINVGGHVIVMPLRKWHAAACVEAARQSAEPVAWIQPDHLQKARIAPFMCRVEPTKRMGDFVPLYTHPPAERIAALEAENYQLTKDIEALNEDVEDWAKLRDPDTLHANLLRGIPAQLSPEQLRHLAGNDHRIEVLEAENAALKETLHNELDGNLRLRDMGGAKPTECMTTFLERVFAERDSLRAEVERLDKVAAGLRTDAQRGRNLEAEVERLRARTLTDEEIKNVCKSGGWDDSWQSIRFARAIEAALRKEQP